MNEFDLIRDVFQRQAAQSLDYSTIRCGIGDDAAVLQFPPNQQVVTCTDTLISGRHFPENTSAFAIGYKAVAVNLSDIAAMGAQPHSILLALAIPQKLKENKGWLTDFAKGLFSCCHEFGVQLIGGDTTRSDVLTISVTALGYAQQCIYRSGAQVGDVIAVTGTLGDAAFALPEVLSGNMCTLQHRLDTPTPRVSIGTMLNGIATSMIDVSDGLIQDLGHICYESSVGAILHLDKLPSHDCLSKLTDDKRIRLQLSGGDDYELLFTYPSHVTLPQSDVAVTIIGEVIEEKGISLYHLGKAYSYHHAGYQHF